MKQNGKSRQVRAWLAVVSRGHPFAHVSAQKNTMKHWILGKNKCDQFQLNIYSGASEKLGVNHSFWERGSDGGLTWPRSQRVCVDKVFTYCFSDWSEQPESGIYYWLLSSPKLSTVKSEQRCSCVKTVILFRHRGRGRSGGRWSVWVWIWAPFEAGAGFSGYYVKHIDELMIQFDLIGDLRTDWRLCLWLIWLLEERCVVFRLWCRQLNKEQPGAAGCFSVGGKSDKQEWLWRFTTVPCTDTFTVTIETTGLETAPSQSLLEVMVMGSGLV